LLAFVSISLCLIVEKFMERRKILSRHGVLLALTAALLIAASPFNALRPENTGPFEGVAKWKAGSAELAVAKKAIGIDDNGGRVLATDEIAGVISRFEQHPRLINVRTPYLDILQPAIGEDAYRPRRVLADFADGTPASEDAVRAALRDLEVSVVVIKAGNATPNDRRLLTSEGYQEVSSEKGYLLWKK
jgi:hypothetical protein